MRKFWTFLCVVLCLLAPMSAASAAERFQVNLTRKDRNLYKVDGTHIWVQTRSCYTYGYGEEAALSQYDVVFLDSGDKCTVRQVLKEADLPSGSYKVTVSQEDDDLYSTLDGAFIRTSMCFEMAMAEDAVLRPQVYGGSLVFLDSGKKCSVEAVFTKIRL